MWMQILVMAFVFFMGILSGLLVAAVGLSITEEKVGAAGWNAQEGIYAFLVYLTTRPGQMPIGASAEVYPFMEAMREFVTRHSLPECREGWECYIIPNPTEYPSVHPPRLTPGPNQTVLE